MKTVVHHIRNIRRQPEDVRRSILHVLTIVFAIILIMLWIYSLGVNVVNSDSKTKAQATLKPFSALKDNIIDGYKSISDPNSDVIKY